MLLLILMMMMVQSQIYARIAYKRARAKIRQNRAKGKRSRNGKVAVKEVVVDRKVKQRLVTYLGYVLFNNLLCTYRKYIPSIYEYYALATSY